MIRNIYCYHHKEFIQIAETIRQAAAAANLTSQAVRNILFKKSPCSRDGWYFSLEEEKDMDKIPDRHGTEYPIKRINKRDCRKEVRNQSYEVNCKDGRVGDIPRSIEGKKALLRQYINKIARYRWMFLAPKCATLERTLIMELIDSI